MGSVQDYGKGCKQGNARANKAQAANDVLTADLRVAGSVVASLHDEVASKGTDHHRTPPPSSTQSMSHRMLVYVISP